MRITADTTVCQGLGQCEYAAPDIFAVSDEMKVEVLDEHPDETHRDDVEQAVRVCPTQALSVED